jgi:hypothetical protein
MMRANSAIKAAIKQAIKRQEIPADICSQNSEDIYLN